VKTCQTAGDGSPLRRSVRAREPVNGPRRLKQRHEPGNHGSTPQGLVPPALDEQRRHHRGEDAQRGEDGARVGMNSAPGNRGDRRRTNQRSAVPVQEDQPSPPWPGSIPSPDSRRGRERQIVGGRRQEHDRQERDQERPRPLPHRCQQECVGGRLKNRLANPAGMRQVVEPRPRGPNAQRIQ
jgi:hypothetical protein